MFFRNFYLLAIFSFLSLLANTGFSANHEIAASIFEDQFGHNNHEKHFQYRPRNYRDGDDKGHRHDWDRHHHHRHHRGQRANQPYYFWGPGGYYIHWPSEEDNEGK